MNRQPVLDSWKQIAAYLDRDERTCQRWERELGLPVHRLDGSPRARVFAYPEELDRWFHDKSQEHDGAKRLDGPEGVASPLRTPRWMDILIAAVTVAAIATGLYLLLAGGNPSASSAERVSLAVLPFVDLSPDKSGDYLGDGIAETLIDLLGRSGALFVTARDSAFMFRGRAEELPEIGRRLNVEYLLDGSVEAAGDRLKVCCRLHRAGDKELIWSEAFDRPVDDILSIGKAIVSKVGDLIKAKSLASAPDSGLRVYSAGASPYLLYLKGRYFWEKREEEDIKAALAFFRDALDEDPVFSLGYVGLADSYIVLGHTFGLPRGEAKRLARAAALKALDIDPLLAEAHASLANIHAWYDLDLVKAHREYRKAIELMPSYATARHWHAFLLAVMKRTDEAVKEIMLARELDPLAPRIAANVGYIFYLCRDYDRALEELLRARELFPQHLAIEGYMGECYAALGRYEDAIEMFRSVYASGRRSDSLLSLKFAEVFGLWGKRRETEEWLSRAEIEGPAHSNPNTRLAVAYGAAGKIDQALAYLEKAVAAKESSLLFLPVGASFDPLRSDPRFSAILKRLGLE